MENETQKGDASAQPLVKEYTLQMDAWAGNTVFEVSHNILTLYYSLFYLVVLVKLGTYFCINLNILSHLSNKSKFHDRLGYASLI